MLVITCRGVVIYLRVPDVLSVEQLLELAWPRRFERRLVSVLHLELILAVVALLILVLVPSKLHVVPVQ